MRLHGMPRVLVAILAKQKEPALPLYLECIEALDYPKESIVLYIRTNNNTDKTERILRQWVERVGHLYAAVEMDASDVVERVEQFREHEWNETRFKVLGRLRNMSLAKTSEHHCDFYFVADVDNFVRPATLRELVALDLPIVAPLLRSISPDRYYSNYHAEIDGNGYYIECDQYSWVLNRHVRGVIEMPLVHCTYLIRTDVLNELTYEDETSRYEYIVFADSARKAGIQQYLDNRQVYGYITFGDHEYHVSDGIERARELLRDAGDTPILDGATASRPRSGLARPERDSPVPLHPMRLIAGSR
ncbi:glycosyltransferase family 2 protein [Mesorhizobium sp. INR15]|uniref:glycosyltransferase family 2 protein n=1 Tax=Mesorhizobium sp. INR15 TaxID=2654248 RepID=UPI0021563DB2|nr:glycosyltransferase family 2 protein [Mesorhizobium sp. INR15]